MGIGDYMCVTLRGGAPWGFTLEEGEGESYRPFLVSQVDARVRLSQKTWELQVETLARPGGKVAQRSLKVPDVRLNCGYFSEREKENNNKQVWGEKAKLAAAHFCARWPCFGARVLGTLIWSRPRESVKLRAAACHHSGRLSQPAGRLASKLEVCWEQRRNTASEGHLWGERGRSRAERIC